MAKPTFDQETEFHVQSGGKNPRFTRENFQAYLRNPNKEVMEFPSSELAAKHGYTVLADVKPSTFDVKDVEAVPFIEKGDKDGVVPGKVMRGRAIILEANFGLVDGQYMHDHQDEIPEEMRKFIIVLSGTLLRDADGYLRVACLCWGDGRWFLLFGWLDGDWVGNDRLARCK